MDDEGQPLDINPAGRDVGGDEKLDPLLFERPHDGIPFLLGEVALQDRDGKSLHGELFTQHDRTGLGPAENDAALLLLALEESADELGFLIPAANRESVVDVAVDDVRLIDLQRLRSFGHAVFDQAVDRIRDGRGEKPSALAGTGEAENFQQLPLKSHAQHLVRLVEDQVLDVEQGERLFLKQI